MLRTPVGVGFLYLLTVQDELVLLELYAIARESADTLYQGVSTAIGALEEDDVPTPGSLEVVCKLVDRDAVPYLEGRNHALRADLERRCDHGPDEAEDEREGDQELT
jgi:hypothetical protein